MNSTAFEKPVTVLVGLGFPKKIDNAFEAFQLLSDMRLTTQKTAQRVALRVCREAVKGAIEPETARSAFVAFAHRCGMLLSSEAGRDVGSIGYLHGRDTSLDRDAALAYKLASIPHQFNAPLVPPRQF